MKKLLSLMVLFICAGIQAQVYNQMDENGNIIQGDEYGNNSNFNPNKRDSTKVNKEITQSLRKSQGEFFFLHNGITAICSSLAVNEGVLHVEGLSVVNGCQSEWRKSQRLVQQ